MSGTMNGHSMSIGYGEPSSVGATMAIGARYCHKALDRVPHMTREEVMRAGGVFRAAAPKISDDIRKADGVRKRGTPRPMTDDDVARILASFDRGRNMAEIAISIHRATSVVRDVLKSHGRDTHRNAGKPTQYRARVVAMLRDGKPCEDIATETGAALGYVRNIASNLKRADRENGRAA